MANLFTITAKFIESGKARFGAWSRKQLALIGVDWPPRHGWKYRVIGTCITHKDAAEFIRIRHERDAIKAELWDTKPAEQNADLRAGRPERLDKRGLPCERCGHETSADDIQCIYGNYWLCPICSRFHQGVVTCHKERT